MVDEEDMMADDFDYLITGAGGGIGGVSRSVVELLVEDGAAVRAMVHREDGRADALRALGAQVVVGDLTDPQDVVSAMSGVKRMFFNMSVSESYLKAAAIVAAAGRDNGGLEEIVNISQMTVSQMTLTSSTESHQHRLHWLVEHVLDWSGLPVTHVRPTVFIDNPLFTFLNAASVRDQHTLVLPFGEGRTSPVAARDVARVVAEILRNPERHREHVYELTGPEILGIDGLARSFSEGLQQPVAGVDIAYDDWVEKVLKPIGLPSHVEQHIATMARLHREGRYDRLTDDVERVTGRPAVTVAQYVAEHRERFGG
jgi:uncharacterized protein YbjT (DUF2867 family)